VLNGRYLPLRQATVHIEDRAINFRTAIILELGEYAQHLEHGLACRGLAETAVLLMRQGSISEGLFHTPAR